MIFLIKLHLFHVEASLGSSNAPPNIQLDVYTSVLHFCCSLSVTASSSGFERYMQQFFVQSKLSDLFRYLLLHGLDFGNIHCVYRYIIERKVVYRYYFLTCFSFLFLDRTIIGIFSFSSSCFCL